MRHRKRRSKLSMMTARRNATLRNMVRSLFRHQRIKTIHARAKEASRLAERLITLAKSDTVADRRAAYSILTDRDMVTKLFREIAPLFKDRNSGYTRVIPLGFRRGDGASLSILELTEKKIVEKLPKKKKAKAKEEGSGHRVQGAGESKKEEKEEVKKEELKKEGKKEESKIKIIPKARPTPEEEKRTEKAKAEGKKVADKTNFMKNLRGLFRKRGDR